MQKIKIRWRQTNKYGGNVHPFERGSMCHKKYTAVFFPFYGDD